MIKSKADFKSVPVVGRKERFDPFLYHPIIVGHVFFFSLSQNIKMRHYGQTLVDDSKKITVVTYVKI
jgi:hypothetical protein